MANSIVQVLPDKTGKKVQSFENTIGSNVGQAQAVTPIDATGWINSFVQVQELGTGKKIQHFANTIDGNLVYALALVRVDSTGTSA